MNNVQNNINYKDGFRLNYNEQFLPKEKVEKYFNRYTQKTIDKYPLKEEKKVLRIML